MSYVTSNKEDTCGSLVPVFDMINHHHDPNCDWNVERGVEIISQDNIEPGDELFIAYGAHGNDLLIQYYGFTNDDQFVCDGLKFDENDTKRHFSHI